MTKKLTSIIPNERLWLLVIGFVVGTILSVIVGTWGEASIIFRAIYVVLFVGLLLAATWSKPNTDKGDNNSDNNPLNTLESKSTHKSYNSTNES